MAGKIGSKVRSSHNGAKMKEGKRVSSVSKGSKKENQVSKRNVDENTTTDPNISTSFNKALASTEKSIRDGAVESLTNYLIRSAEPDSEPLSSLEMAKLWKGIFYCFWMSDKPRVQHALAQQMADILLAIESSRQTSESSSSTSTSDFDPSWQFFEGFLDTMVREWWGLDKHRVDKFMMLVRRFFNAAFRLLDKQEWNANSINRFTAILSKEGGILYANDVKKPAGLFYHICDLYLEELEKAVKPQLAEEEEEEDKEDEEEIERKDIPVTALLQPFVEMAANSQTALYYSRIMEAVLSPYIDASLHWENLDQNGSDDDDEDDDELYPSLFKRANQTPSKLRKEIFAGIFTAASRSDSFEPRRRALFKLFRDEQDRLEEEEE